jgi:hypothetical protein
MILNAFVEGLLAVIAGVVCYVLGAILNVPEVTHMGDLLTGIGIGYMGHQALVTPPPSK